MAMSLITKTYEHNGLLLEVPFTQTAFFNATAVAKAFGKQPTDWLKTDATKEYILAAQTILCLEQNQLVIVKNGGNQQGTWLHPKLAVAFARWCNAEFAVWCDMQIDTILRGDSKPKVPREERYQLGVYRDAVRTAKLLGLSGNAALLSADQYVRNTLGCNVLEMFGATHLLADPRGMTYTPTQLGKLLTPALSPIAVNKLLACAGLQTREFDSWLPADAAQGLFEWSDTGKRHTDGAPVKQLKWFKDVLAHLQTQSLAA